LQIRKKNNNNPRRAKGWLALQDIVICIHDKGCKTWNIEIERKEEKRERGKEKENRQKEIGKKIHETLREERKAKSEERKSEGTTLV